MPSLGVVLQPLQQPDPVRLRDEVHHPPRVQCRCATEQEQVGIMLPHVWR